MEKKRKPCGHTASYYSQSKGAFICQYCGTSIKTLESGAKKKVHSPGDKTGSSNAGNKIGYEKQDPRITEAEKLNRRLLNVNLKIKKESEKTELERLESECDDIKAQMKAIQATYED